MLTKLIDLARKIPPGMQVFLYLLAILLIVVCMIAL